MDRNFFLDRLGIKNFRSIDEDGIYLDGMKQINLLIGKNNCGKSNVLKLLKLLKQHSKKAFPNTLENQHNRNGKSPVLYFRFTHKEFSFPEKITVRYDLQNQTHNYKVNLIERLKEPLIANYNIHDHLTSIKPEFFQSYQEENTIREIAVALDVDESRFQKWTAIEKHLEQKVINPYLSAIEKVIYIPDFRFVNEGANFQQSTSDIHGSNIISEIFKMKNPKIGDERNKDKFSFIEKTIGKLIGEDNLTIEIPHDVKEMYLNVQGFRLPLEYFGTGLQEIILLCSALIIHENHLICIEEPEIHLHPELQKKFLSFLLETNNQYIITTHSNSILDFSNKNISIYHFTHNGISSKVNRCLNDNHSKYIIEDLGYKNSDLLQSNGIIWVEGPSDRAYINKWISLKSSEYKEGIHYTIMFYGGKLLSHLSCLFDFINDELIQLLKINSNAYVVMDRDNLNKKINETKQRISREIGEGHYWITAGLEIENYLSLETINNWLKSKKKKLLMSPIEKQKKFEEEIMAINFNFDYSKNKNLYSKELIPFISNEDLKQLDVNKKIDEIITLIKKWNR